MLKPEEITPGTQIAGLLLGELVTIDKVESYGSQLRVVYKKASGGVDEVMLGPADLERLSVPERGRAWSFDADPETFRLVLEALRIDLGFLFDPMTAIHSSQIDPLPHQISAVYDTMLPRNPLRFVLADDPGAGKTIMAGLLIKELIFRGDVQRVLIVAPGGLVEQWQDEMRRKFDMHFDIFPKNQSEAGNFFNKQDRVIIRLDQIARNKKLKGALEDVQWDLVVADEAHRLAAHWYPNRAPDRTKRYYLAETLAKNSRHFLMMTATPHTGKQEDFNLWLSLLDPDRFYLGNTTENPTIPNISDVMRRMIKEDLLKFDRTHLFPERQADTIQFTLSPKEKELYEQVTEYVRTEMNRAERLKKKRRNIVGFALTVLQRRLASSPYAIYESLKRRLEFLNNQLEERIKHPEKFREEEEYYEEWENEPQTLFDSFDDEDDFDEDDDKDKDDNKYDFYSPKDDRDANATAAHSIEEVRAEIKTVEDLVDQARIVYESGEDCKWAELSDFLDKDVFKREDKKREKLIIFTEYRDTLDYLKKQVDGVIGNPEAVVTIHGGTSPSERHEIQENFLNNPDVSVLIATDAAGEGINLQRAHFMINYDIPWNPNRLEQRFGRIHRIGQTEPCFMWNMVATDTREGDVFRRIFEKLNIAREKLGGKIFDIIGKVFEDEPLQSLLIKAIKYSESPEAQSYMTTPTDSIDVIFKLNHLQQVLDEDALVGQRFNLETLYAVKAEMDKAEARKLQPCYVRSFFVGAFNQFGWDIRPRGDGRYEIPHTPPVIKNNQKVLKKWNIAIADKYGMICFEKEQISSGRSKKQAEFVHPGHPLMRSLTDLILENHGSVLKPGTVLFDSHDEGTEPSLIFMIDHRVTETDTEIDVSRRLQFVRIRPDGSAENVGMAPHLDLDIPSEEVIQIAQEIKEQAWLNRDIEQIARAYAAEKICPDHFEEAKRRRLEWVDKTRAAVEERLGTAVKTMGRQAVKGRDDVKKGIQLPLNQQKLERTYEELKVRLANRRTELEKQRQLSNKPPVVMGGILVIPKGLLDKKHGVAVNTADAEARKKVEMIAMNRVMETERSFGHTVIDVSAENCGWDVTAIPPAPEDGSPVKSDRHIEVKGRNKDADTITFTHNEIGYAVNQKDKFILAIVLVDGDHVEGPFYVRNPFKREPELGVTSVNWNIKHLMDMAVDPRDTL